jgi:DNA invertase Pin-like site-specific DNA recombinase
MPLVKNNKGEPMENAIAYIRVSTEEQATEGVSIDAQGEKVRAYATLRGLNLVDVVIDAGVSAGKPLADREGGRRVLDAIRSKRATAVVAVKLDRVFRDAADCLAVTREWDKRGVSFHILDMGGQSIDTSTAMGRMFLTMAAGFAELERNLIRERTASALQHKRSKGEYVGEVPFGCDLAADGKTLTPNSTEQEAINLMRELRSKGLSYRSIAAELDKTGIRPKKGNRWIHTSVRSALTRAA